MAYRYLWPGCLDGRGRRCSGLVGGGGGRGRECSGLADGAGGRGRECSGRWDRSRSGTIRGLRLAPLIGRGVASTVCCTRKDAVKRRIGIIYMILKTSFENLNRLELEAFYTKETQTSRSGFRFTDRSAMWMSVGTDKIRGHRWYHSLKLRLEARTFEHQISSPFFTLSITITENITALCIVMGNLITILITLTIPI